MSATIFAALTVLFSVQPVQEAFTTLSEEQLMASEPITVYMESTVGEVFREIADRASAKLVVAEGVDLETTCGVRFNVVPWKKVVFEVARLNRLTAEFSGSTVRLSPLSD